MKRLVALAMCLLMNSPTTLAQDGIGDIEYDPAGEFNFVRVQFDSYGSSRGFGGGWGFGGSPWSIDFPDADQNFLRGVARLTNVRVMQEPIVLRFDDERIF